MVDDRLSQHAARARRTAARSKGLDCNKRKNRVARNVDNRTHGGSWKVASYVQSV